MKFSVMQIFKNCMTVIASKVAYICDDENLLACSQNTQQLIEKMKAKDQ